MVTGEFKWPEPIPVMQMEQLLDESITNDVEKTRRLSELSATAKSNVRRLVEKAAGDGIEVERKPVVVDCDSSKEFAKAWVARAPCFLASRCKGPWVSSLNRRMNNGEILRCLSLIHI